MKYFLDTEFLEGTQKKTIINKGLTLVGFLFIAFGFYYVYKHTLNNVDIIYLVFNFLIGVLYLIIGKANIETKPTIDLISIGIVSEDNREYYAINKDFNLKEAWNRYQIEQVSGDGRNRYPNGIKNYWIRDNVLKPIFHELIEKEYDYRNKQERLIGYSSKFDREFTYKNFKRLINKYGKSNKQIAEEIKSFTHGEEFIKTINTGNAILLDEESRKTILRGYTLPQFYAYYANYDWVVFCWLFGRMIDLPKGFPMYCIDLKQEMDNKRIKNDKGNLVGLQAIKSHPNYPKQTNEHNALVDAKWNKELYEFLNTI